MEKKSKIQLIDYMVNKACYEVNDNFIDYGKAITINPKFTRKVNKIDESNFKLFLGVSVSGEENIPFFAEVIISAIFQSDKWEEKENQWVISNSTAILYPFLRTVLSNLTLNSNMPPYILPVININSVFSE